MKDDLYEAFLRVALVFVICGLIIINVGVAVTSISTNGFENFLLGKSDQTNDSEIIMFDDSLYDDVQLLGLGYSTINYWCHPIDKPRTIWVECLPISSEE